MSKLPDGQWEMSKEEEFSGKKLGLGLLLSVKNEVPGNSQNEALAATLSYILGKHYVTIHEKGGAKEADGWLSLVLNAASVYATKDGVPIGFAFLKRDK